MPCPPITILRPPDVFDHASTLNSPSIDPYPHQIKAMDTNVDFNAPKTDGEIEDR
jgi:hypothetical protein